MRSGNKALIISLVIALVFSLVSPSLSEQMTWDCLKCGRTGNTGRFCGNCGNPAPNTNTSLTKPLINPFTGMNLLNHFSEIQASVKYWTEWDASSAPQSLEHFPMLPSFVLPLYEELKKTGFEIEQQGKTYIVHTNISELFPEDQFEITVWCEDQQIRGKSERVKPTSMGDSFAFECPEGYSFSLIECRISYFSNQTEQIVIDFAFENQQMNSHGVYLLFDNYAGFSISYQTNSFMQNALEELMAITIMDNGHQVDFQYNLNGQLTFFNK